MTTIRPRRSALYLPASNARAVEKARTLPCDVVILDLEDAVAPDAKLAAREAAVAAVQAGGFGHREVVIRVNGFGTPWMADDVAAVAAVRPDAIQMPKVDTVAQAADAVRMAAGLPVWVMIESPRAVLDADRIAGVDGVAALVSGLADLAKDLGATAGRDRTELLYAIQKILISARAWGRLAFDGVHAAITDLDGLAESARQGAAMGYDGKTIVHPSHIEATNAAFSPSEAVLAHARGLLAAHEAAKAEGKGVTTYNGKMIEVLHVAEARKQIAFAEAIAARG